MWEFDIFFLHSIVWIKLLPILCIDHLLSHIVEEIPLNRRLELYHNRNSKWDIEIQTTKIHNRTFIFKVKKNKLRQFEQLTMSLVMPRTTQLFWNSFKMPLKSSNACELMPLIHLGKSSIRLLIKLSSAPGHSAGVE